uniref:Uncharacterized protein n=1 Tax=Cohnella candidum TaxID=2674991 RepID=A0A3G3JUF5_9BACL|nr:hypothetical protein EAV92_04420 [Cohnella candidum]
MGFYWCRISPQPIAIGFRREVQPLPAGGRPVRVTQVEPNIQQIYYKKLSMDVKEIFQAVSAKEEGPG